MTFNTEVDATTASNVANYEIKADTNPVTINNKNIKVSGKTALLPLDTALEPGNKYVVQVKDGVESKSGAKLTPFTTDSTLFSSVSAPKLEKTELGVNSLVFTFDKPVKTNPAVIKVDGLALAAPTLTLVGSSTAGNYTYSASLTTAQEKTIAKKMGNHAVTLFDVAETSTNLPAVASVINGSYSVTEANATAPKVVGIKALNSNKFFIQTDKTVVADDANSFVIKKGTHEFLVSAASGIGTPASDFNEVKYAAGTDAEGNPGYYVIITDDDSSTPSLNPLYKDGETSVNLSVKFTNYKEPGSSLLGEQYTGSVTLNKSADKPSVKETTVDGSGNLVVQFKNKVELATGASAVPANVIVRDKDGVVVPSTTGVTGVAIGTAGNEDKVTITLAAAYQDKAPYTVEFKADKYQYSENITNVPSYQLVGAKNDTFTTTVNDGVSNVFKYVTFTDLLDTGKGTTPGSGIDINSDNEVIFYFKENLDASAINKANYLLDGSALPTGTSVDFLGDKKTVQLTFPEGTFNYTTDYRLTVSNNVKTESGKIVVKDLQSKAAHVQTINVVDNVKPVLTDATYVVPATGSNVVTDKIKVSFSEAIDTSSLTNFEDNFKVVVNGNTITADSVIAGTEDNELVITLANAVNPAQAATVTVVEDSSEVVHIKDKATPANTAKVGATATASTKEVDASQFTTEQGYVNSAVSALQAITPTVTDDDKAISTITLPTQSNVTIDWTATEGSIAAGVYSTPARTDAPQTITITGVVRAGAISETVTFDVIVGDDDTTISTPDFDNVTTATQIQ